MQEVNLNYKEMNWGKTDNIFKGAEKIILRDEEVKKTFLVKLPKNYRGSVHIHESTDQHFVLEGSYKSGGVSYSAGTYRLIPKGNAHDPVLSENGALILVIKEKV
jgi:mannose-6-phosphate isomerase-like protein (cupin superfamily)